MGNVFEFSYIIGAEWNIRVIRYDFSSLFGVRYQKMKIVLEKPNTLLSSRITNNNIFEKPNIIETPT